MGAKCVKFFVLYFCSLCISIVSYPIGETVDQSETVPKSAILEGWPQLLAFAFTLTCVLVLIGCLSCCKQRAGFKEFRNSASESNVNSVGLDFVNPLQNVAQPSRYSIFSSIAEATIEKQPDSVVTFEPLPKVLPKFSNLRLPQFNENSTAIGFIEDWLGDRDFPRQQLHYLRECGQGWFGKVVEGEARGILPSSNKVYRVLVKILKEDASAAEQAFFLQEAKPYKDLTHPNVLKLLGRCLENVPFLLVFETCSNGDLKNYLKQNVGNRDALIFQGIILRMAVDVASGLSYMLQHSFVHTDVAARNCLVTSDLRVKVGDYGTSIQTYKDEYYISGDIALPIRWCAPETLSCTDTTIEPKPVTGASCIWSYAVLLWELEEWGELPYKELNNEQVITNVFVEGLRLPYPSLRTPYTAEMYNIMQECWKDYVDRPSFIHVMNALSALMHRFKNNDFDSRWNLSKPNTIPVTDNDEKINHSKITSLSIKSDNDSGIDLDNPKTMRGGLSMLQLQQASSRQRLMNDECSSDSPASSRRFSNSSTGDLFSSSISMKHRSPSLENLHGSLDNIGSFNGPIPGDEIFGCSSDFGWQKTQNEERRPELDFRLGLVSNNDASILWNNKPLFQNDSYLEDNSFTKRVDSFSTDAEEEIWRKRIERGEFTEKVKEKSKSVADLMILTHIDCSESSESDSLPSFHSRQSSFNRQSRRLSTKNNAPVSLLNSLNFGSESNLLAVEKDPNFQDALKKIQIAKINKDEESLNFISLQANSLVPSKESQSGKIGHFLANDASEKHLHSSHINNAFCNAGTAKTKLPLFDSSSFEDSPVKDASKNEMTEHDDACSEIKNESPKQSSEDPSPEPLPIETFFQIETFPATETLNSSSVHLTHSNNSSEGIIYSPVSVESYSVGEEFVRTHTVENCQKDVVSNNTETVFNEEPISMSFDLSSSASTSTKEENTFLSLYSSDNADSVVIGPSENDTLEFFKGLKTTLDEEKSNEIMELCEQYGDSPRTLHEFLNDSGDDYFYKCTGDEIIHNQDPCEHRDYRAPYCDYCYAKCHFSNECLRCKDKSLEENCSCESFENLEKFRDCTVLNSCPFQSDDSGRGTDQINSGDGSSDKSLEGSISVQMNEVKNRLEDVIAKFAIADDLSDDNCSSLEDDKEVKYVEDIATDCGKVDEKVELEKTEIEKIVVLKNNEELVIEEMKALDKLENGSDEFKVITEEVNDSCDEKIECTEKKTSDLNFEEINDGEVLGTVRRDSLFAISEENETSTSFEEDTCIGTGVGSSYSGRWSEDGDLESDLKDEDDKNNNSSKTFVKVEQLFFTVDPKFEKEIEAEFNKSSGSFLDDIRNDTPETATSNEEVSISCNPNKEQATRELPVPENEECQVLNDTFLKAHYSDPHIVQETIETKIITEMNAEHETVDSDDSSSSNDDQVEYEISDILEGLSEPISLPYSVNQQVTEKIVHTDPPVTDSMNCENDNISNSWLPSPMEQDCCKRFLEMDEKSVEAIRNELREKLPNSSTLALVEPEEQNVENTNITIEYNTYPAQLSPILEEEEEEEYSPFSSLLSVIMSSSESDSSETINCGVGLEGEDFLVVDTETNEASILGQTNTFSCSSFNKRHHHKLNETYEIDENDDTIALTDTMDSDSFPSPDSLSPGTSSKTGAHLSYSSSECGNLSDVFLSPSSSKNFDEFDIDRNVEDSRHLNTPENTLHSCRDDYQKAILNIDEMLKKSEVNGDRTSSTSSIPCADECSHVIDQERRNRDETWLKSFFTPTNETASLVDFNSSDDAEREFRSLPADYKSENWPLVDKLMLRDGKNEFVKVDVDQVPILAIEDRAGEEKMGRSEVVKPSFDVQYEKNIAALPTDISDRQDDTQVVEESLAEIKEISKSEINADIEKIKDECTKTSDIKIVEEERIPASANEISIKSIENAMSVWNNSTSQSAKLKNSIALFGNGSGKQIRNFQVSVVEDDSYLNKLRSSPTSPTYLTERLGTSTSPKSSEKTWKSPLNSFLNNQNLETLGLKEISVNDMMMSTSFIENGSQDGSVDGKDGNQSKSDDSDDEGLESTSEEFEWKNNDQTESFAQCKDKKTEINEENDIEDDVVDDDDDDDDDDEELTDFVPFSWNIGAIPQRSALKNKDKTKMGKKNVSFKKQKYHCVYEYPKEEPNYPRRYDTLLQERMLNFWNFNQEYLYNDYASFSDWELDDCDEQSTCSDDLLPFPGTSSQSSRTGLSNKLGFYTIGTYDIDSNTRGEDISSNYLNSNLVSSPTTSYLTPNCSVLSPTHTNATTDGSETATPSPNGPERISTNSKEFNFENIKLMNGEKNSPSNDAELEDLPSPGLGELRHTKNRLKLDLSSKTTPFKVDSNYEKSLLDKCDCEKASMQNGTKNEDLETTDDFVNDYGLNYKSCDLSPVVELKSLTSTSVA